MTLRAKHLLVLCLYWAAIYLASTGYPPALLDDADTVHAEAAREMAESGDWVTLHANHIRYLEKAPFLYWTVALSYKIFGAGEFATRLPITLATLALILATYFFGKKIHNERAGFYSALGVTTMAGIYLFTRVLWPDIMLALFLLMTFYCFLRGAEDSRFYYGMYLFSALAVLTKGLIGAFFPGMILFAYLIVTRQIAELRKIKLIPGTLLFLIIAAPWHLLAGFRNQGFFWFYFINEHFLRYVGARYPMDYDTVPLGLFVGLHLVWLFPWSFFLPLSLREIPNPYGPLDREKQPLLLLWIWILAILLFFSFSTRQEYYTLPTYPAFALLIGLALARAEQTSQNEKWLKGSQLALLVLGVLVFVAGTAVLFVTRNIRAAGDISQTLGRNPQAYALSLGHILDLTPQTMANLRFPVAGTAITFLTGSVAAALLRWKGKHVPANVCCGLMMVAFFYFARLSLARFEPYLSSRPLAEAILRVHHAGDVIVLNGEYESGSSINFYTREMVYILNGRSANLEYGSYFPDAPRIFLVNRDLERMWQGPHRIFLCTDASDLEELQGWLPGPVFRVAESGGKLVLSNRQSG